MYSLRPQDLKSLCRFTFLFLDSASSASLPPSAIIVFFLFFPFAFSLFRQKSPSNNTLPNPFKCNTYEKQGEGVARKAETAQEISEAEN